MSDSGWRVKKPDKEHSVPDLETLRQWAAERRILPSDYVYNPTLEKWIYARDVAELEGIFEAPPGPVSVSAASPRDEKRSSEGKARPEPQNGYAVTGLVLGVASVLLSFIGLIPILAVVFSGIGLAKVGERGGKGKVAAWIGLILGVLYTLVYMQQAGYIG